MQRQLRASARPCGQWAWTCGSTRATLRGGDAWDSQIKKQIHECALVHSGDFGAHQCANRGLLPPRMEPRRAATAGHGAGHRFPGASGDRRDARSGCARPRGIPARALDPTARWRDAARVCSSGTRIAGHGCRRRGQPARSRQAGRHPGLGQHVRQDPETAAATARCTRDRGNRRSARIRMGRSRMGSARRHEAVGRSSARHDRIAGTQRRRARLRESRRFGRIRRPRRGNSGNGIASARPLAGADRHCARILICVSGRRRGFARHRPEAQRAIPARGQRAGGGQQAARDFEARGRADRRQCLVRAVRSEAAGPVRRPG